MVVRMIVSKFPLGIDQAREKTEVIGVFEPMTVLMS